MKIAAREAVVVSIGIVLVSAAFSLPHLHLHNLATTPMIHVTPKRFTSLAGTAPIFGWWDVHVGWGTPAAAVLGMAAVLWGPTSACWAFSLAMIDGWQRGFAGRLTAQHEYLRQVPTITDIPVAVRTFASRIVDYQPHSWMTHVSGHPPGALLTFVWLDRLGLGGGAWAGLLCLLVGSSAATAVVVTLRAVGDEVTARRAAPFVALAPTAIWVAVSADGYFAGVAGWGIALCALATRSAGRKSVLLGAAAGLLLGWSIFLSYGLPLMGVLVLAVLACSDDWRARTRVVLPGMLSALAVVAAFAIAGFWWFDGYVLVQQRYWQGIACDRPFQYWIWANLASVVCAVGLGSLAGIGKAFDLGSIRRRSGLHLLVIAAAAAIVVADLSQLSKAETERIWLPFMVWLTAAPVLLSVRSQRWWLALNIIIALVLNSVIFTNW